MLKVNLKTMPLTQCNTTLLEYNQGAHLSALRNGIDSSQYCVHDPEARKDSCQGDSGGPLQLVGDETVPTQIVGIVSFGISCATRLPGLYTRVAHYINWIEPIVWPSGEVGPLLASPVAS